MKKISVIIPIFNGEKRIKKCMDSIVNQTYTNLEMILINDGSTDKVDSIIQTNIHEYQQKIDVKYICQQNQGVATTRNLGIAMASGEYTTFVDQDDYLPENYFECYMRHAEDDNYDIVVGGYKRISDEGKVSRVVSLKEGEWSKFIVTAPWAHLYKTEFLRMHQIEFLSTGLGEDIYFNVLAYSYTDRIKVIPDSNYMWVDNPKSVSNSKQNTIRKDRSPLLLMNQLMKNMPEDNKISKEILEFFFARYVVWYFLFTVRGSNVEDIMQMYDLTEEWMMKYFPNHMKNKNISLFRPEKEPISIRICVWGFYLLKKIGLIKFFLKVISKI